MKKTILIVIITFLLVQLSGCEKKDAVGYLSMNNASMPDIAKTIHKNVVQHTEKLKIAENERIKAEESLQSEESSVSQPVSESFVASYMPANGTYINRTNGGFPHTCELRVRKKDERSFLFSIWEIIDENRNACNNIIFMENTAVFDAADSTTAVFYGQTYTVYFDCSEPNSIVLSGFEPALLLGNDFINVDAMERAAGMIP